MVRHASGVLARQLGIRVRVLVQWVVRPQVCPRKSSGRERALHRTPHPAPPIIYRRYGSAHLIYREAPKSDTRLYSGPRGICGGRRALPRDRAGAAAGLKRIYTDRYATVCTGRPAKSGASCRTGTLAGRLSRSIAYQCRDRGRSLELAASNR